jgi:hypothetical protein
MVRVIDALAEVHLQCVSSTARRKTLLQRLPYVPQMWLNTISHLRAIATDGHQVDADGGTQKKIRHWGVQATKEKASCCSHEHSERVAVDAGIRDGDA